MPKPKATTSTRLSNHTLLNFFSTTPVRAEVTPALPSSSPESRKTTGSALKRKSPAGSVLGTCPENAVFIYDSSEDEVDVHPIPPPKKGRATEHGSSSSRVPPPAANLCRYEDTPTVPPDYTRTNIKVEEHSWTAEDAFEPLFDCESEVRGEFNGLMEEDIIEDSSYQYEDNLDRETEHTSSASVLSVCPVCSMLFNEEDDPQLHVNRCLDTLRDRPGVELPDPRSTRPLPPPETHSSRVGLSTDSAALDGESSDSTRSQAEPSSRSSRAGVFNIFSVLMSAHKENAAWKEAERDEARAGTKLNAERLAQQRKNAGGKGRRLAPFYKVMQGMPIAVDAFRYGKIPGVRAYFLSHFHSDHYTNLASSWKNGPIYCSSTTANLVKKILNVSSSWVHALPLDIATRIPDTDVTVTLIEANHCPGSVLFLLEGRQTVNAGDSTYVSPHIGSERTFRYLHCGDFRASPQHVLHPAIKGKRIDLVYLDTTYLNPKYCFPPQKQVIDACAALAKQQVFGGRDVKLESEGDSGDTKTGGLSGWLQPSVKKEEVDSESARTNTDRALVVVGTYSIGKERIVKAIARALCSKVYIDARKQSILECQDDQELHALLTRDPLGASVHLVPLGSITLESMGDYLAQFKGFFTRTIAFRPSGWSYVPPAGADVTLPPIAPLIAKQQARVFTASSFTPMRGSTSKHSMYGVPYSEHSSFTELTCFALSLHWTRILATVNVGTQAGRAKMQRWFEKWAVERKRRIEHNEPEHELDGSLHLIDAINIQEMIRVVQ